MKKERKERIKSSAISWIVAIICAIGIAVIMLCAAHSKGLLLKARADSTMTANTPYYFDENRTFVTMGGTPAPNQYGTIYWGNGNNDHIDFTKIQVDGTGGTDVSLNFIDLTNYSQVVIYYNNGIYNRAEYYADMYDLDTMPTSLTPSNIYIALYQSITGPMADYLLMVFDTEPGSQGGDSGGGDNGSGTVNDTPTPGTVTNDSDLLGIVIPRTVPNLSGTVNDQERLLLFGYEITNAGDYTDTNSRAVPIIVQVLDNNGNILVQGETSLSQQRKDSNTTTYYYVPLCPMLYEYGYINIIENAYETRIRFKNAQDNTAWFTFDAQWRASNYSTIYNELWVRNNASFAEYNQYIGATGYDTGYNAGYTAGTSQAESALGIYRGMDIVTGIFVKIGEILSIPIFGNIPLAVFILIPLIMGVVYVILKFVR